MHACLHVCMYVCMYVFSLARLHPRVLTPSIFLSKMSKLAMAGSYVALVTPFTDADEVDYDKISELVDWHCKEG